MKGSTSVKSSQTLADHVLSSLGELRQIFTEVLEAYGRRIQDEMKEIEQRVRALADERSRMSDLRELLALLRNLQVKPDRGRRKDLKKIDSLVGDLTMIVENWRTEVDDKIPEKTKPPGEAQALRRKRKNAT